MSHLTVAYLLILLVTFSAADREQSLEYSASNKEQSSESSSAESEQSSENSSGKICGFEAFARRRWWWSSSNNDRIPSVANNAITILLQYSVACLLRYTDFPLDVHSRTNRFRLSFFTTCFKCFFKNLVNQLVTHEHLTNKTSLVDLAEYPQLFDFYK